MEHRLIISLEDFPPTGRHISGELDGSLFGFDNDEIQSVGPLSYDLDVQLFDTELLATGTISAPFLMRCGRCLESFEHIIECQGVSVSDDCTNKLVVDFTEQLREEIVLDIPTYPKCELSGLECEINADFSDFRLDNDPQSSVQSATPSSNSVWDALNQFPEK
ncbi:MAG: hypothetical protein R3Y56_10070 [Akkermansia sp.]